MAFKSCAKPLGDEQLAALAAGLTLCEAEKDVVECVPSA
jgi:hypothetical protein